MSDCDYILRNSLYACIRWTLMMWTAKLHVFFSRIRLTVSKCLILNSPFTITSLFCHRMAAVNKSKLAKRLSLCTQFARV